MDFSPVLGVAAGLVAGGVLAVVGVAEGCEVGRVVASRAEGAEPVDVVYVGGLLGAAGPCAAGVGGEVGGPGAPPSCVVATLGWGGSEVAAVGAAACSVVQPAAVGAAGLGFAWRGYPPLSAVSYALAWWM